MDAKKTGQLIAQTRRALGLTQGDLANTGTGTGEPPKVHEGESILLVRMYCR